LDFCLCVTIYYQKISTVDVFDVGKDVFAKRSVPQNFTLANYVAPDEEFLLIFAHAGPGESIKTILLLDVCIEGRISEGCHSKSQPLLNKCMKPTFEDDSSLFALIELGIRYSLKGLEKFKNFACFGMHETIEEIS
jgi:hypothetical protein